MKKENTYINEKFKEICKRLSEQDKENSEKNEKGGKNKKYGKKYENYVVYAIWNRLRNYNLEPVREKGITRTKYRIDLYFPQLNIGIECDEQYHENQKEEDKKRKKKIIEIMPGYKEFRIKIYSKGAEKETSLNEIESKIDKIVEKIKERIKSKNIKPWNLPRRATEQYFKNKKTISTDDDVIFGSQRDALKIIFAWENKGTGPIKGFFTPTTLRKSEYKEYNDYKVWFPKLGSKNDYGNKWDKECGIFSEKDNEKLNKNNRIIFVGLDNGEKYEFAGIFRFDGLREETKDGIPEKMAYWKRISKEFPIIKA